MILPRELDYTADAAWFVRFPVRGVNVQDLQTQARQTRIPIHWLSPGLIFPIVQFILQASRGWASGVAVTRRLSSLPRKAWDNSFV
ncbi:hypothetical protein WAI453_012005 [Rhynchosporium graminicola]